MRYRVRHSTRYVYSAAVSHCHNSIYMKPRDAARQHCIDSAITVTPEACSYAEKKDTFGNPVIDFSIYKPHHELEVTSECLVETRPENWDRFAQHNDSCADVLAQLYQSSDYDVLEAVQFLAETPLTAADSAITALASSLFVADAPFVQAVQQLNQTIHQGWIYDPDCSDVSTTAAQVNAQKAGVCQDFAHLAIACLRSAGFPARYISGYLETASPDGEEKLIGTEATHAWLSVFIPNMGWLEIDPTNNMLPNEQHIITAWGRDYADVAPLSGVVSGAGVGNTLSVSVEVKREQT